MLFLQAHLSADDARQQLLRILRALPYGTSVFFSVRKIDDPIGLLPGRIILGINKRGVCVNFSWMILSFQILVKFLSWEIFPNT